MKKIKNFQLDLFDLDEEEKEDIDELEIHIAG